MPRQVDRFTNPFTGEPVSADQYANYLGDPQGDSTFNEEWNWAQQYAKDHPDWKGNEIIGADHGSLTDKRGWLDKHTGLLIGLGMAGVGGVAGLTGAFSGAANTAAGAGAASASSAGSAAPLASTPISGAALTPAVSGSTGALGSASGLAAGPALTSGVGTTLPGTSLPIGMGTTGATPSMIAPNLATSANISPKAGGLMSRLLDRETLQGAGKGISAIANSQAHNRGAALDAMMSGDQNKISADAQNQRVLDDILRQMQIADYIKNGGAQNRPMPKSASGRDITQFNFGLGPISDEQKQHASEIEDLLMQRLHNPVTLSDYNSKMNPSKTESIMNWVGPAAQTLGYFF